MTRIAVTESLDIINRLLNLNKMELDTLEIGTFEYELANSYHTGLMSAKFAILNPSQFDLNNSSALKRILEGNG